MRALTKDELQAIADDNPPPEPFRARVYCDGDSCIEVAGDTRRYEVRVYADGAVAVTCMDTLALAGWAVRVAKLVQDARAKPALVELPDVSDLPGVMLSRDGVDRVYVQVATDCEPASAVLDRQPDGEWRVDRSLSYADALFAAGIVAERLNRMERDR